MLEALAEDVQAGIGRDAAALADLARRVEHREVQPRVAAPVAGRPDHRRDAAGPEVEPGRLVGEREPGWGSGSRTSVVRPVASMWASMSARTRRMRASALATVRPRSAAKPTSWPSMSVRRPVSSTPAAWRVARSRVRWSGRPTELQRGLVAGGDRVRRLVDGAVEAADALQPPVDVHAAVAARQPAVAADGEDDVTAGAGELVGELHAGGRGADDQHTAGRQRVRAAIGRRRDLGDGAVEVVGP